MNSKITDSLKFNIGKLWNSGVGTTEKFSLDAPVKFDDKEINPVSNLVADIMLINLKEEVSAIVENAEITLKRKCEKCLTTYEQTIEIVSAERQFISTKIDPEDDPNENFLIDFSQMTIALYEMIRQEIILHFSLISVCSKSCEGLCPACGKNQNKSKCSCKTEDLERQKPFKNLKNIIKK